MSDKRRTAVRNTGAFLGPGMGSGGGNAPMPTNAISVGVGKPGPGDEWKMPSGSIDEVVAQDDEPAETAEPAQSGHRGLLRRLTRGR